MVAMVDATDGETGMTILNRVLDEEENTLDASQIFLVRNKKDLASGQSETLNVDRSDIGGVFDVSCLTQEGIDEFLGALTDRVVARISGDGDESSSEESTEGVLITRARHRQHVRAASEALDRFIVLSQEGSMALDMAAEELRLAASELGRITGAVDVEDVLDKLFTDFCIGK